MPLRTCLIVGSLLALLVAGCGGGSAPERTSAAAATPTPSAVESLLATTFNNLDKIKSGTVDLKLDIAPSGSGAQPVSAHLGGPFSNENGSKIGDFAFNAKLTAASKSITAGATFVGGRGFVALQGTQYALSAAQMQQITSAASQQDQRKRGLLLNTLGVDFSKWLTNPRNEGTATVGDAQTTKLTGDANVSQVIGDLDKVAAKAQSLNLPGVSGTLPQQLTPQQKQAEIQAIKNLTVTVYTGAQDKILRRLVVAATVADSGTTSQIGFDLTFTGLGQPQTITAPKHAKSFAELQKAMQAAGLSAPASSGSTEGGGNNVDKYAQCIAQANGDKSKARDCAAVLAG